MKRASSYSKKSTELSSTGVTLTTLDLSLIRKRTLAASLDQEGSVVTAVA